MAKLRMVDHCIPDLLAAIVPATPEERTWVVETGRPNMSAAAMVVIATSSADAPWAYVRWLLPIFSPTVTTILFQPTIVPRPRAIATATFTHIGINLVALSISFLKDLRFPLASAVSNVASDLSRK